MEGSFEGEVEWMKAKLSEYRVMTPPITQADLCNDQSCATSALHWFARVFSDLRIFP